MLTQNISNTFVQSGSACSHTIKETARFANRELSHKNQATYLHIDRSQKQEIIFSLGSRKVAFFYFPFSIMGRNFDCINGNYPDKHLNDCIEHDSNDLKITISEPLSKESESIDMPDHWQRHLLETIRFGLLNKFGYRTDFLTRSLTKALAFLFSRNSNPNCREFSQYITTGSTKETIIYVKNEIKGKTLAPDFCCLILCDKEKPVHMFIHLKNNICISKLGDSEVYFHSIEDITKFYSQHVNANLCLHECE